MKIVWRGIAVEDLREARRHIAADDPGTAARVYDAIPATVERLAEFPNLGRPGRVAGTRELVVPRTPDVVAYRVAADHLRVLPILHGAREWPEQT